MPLGLLALAIGGFGIGLTEFVIMGLLPEVASDFGVTETVAGYLISGYALSVLLGALLLTAAVTRFSKKKVLISLMLLFIIGNLTSAVAPTFGLLMAGRVIAALCHGAFFGIGSVLAASLVAPDKKAGAIAIMFAGLTTANVLGVPLGTLLGQQLGWRSTFWAITVIGLVALAGIVALVPKPAPEAPPSLRTELRAFGSSQVWLSIVATILGFGGMFGSFTYIAFTLTEVSGFASGAVPWLLILFGAGLFVGNLVGGRAADRALDPTLIIFFGALAAVLIIFALVASNQLLTIISLLAMGAFGFCIVPGLQMRVMKFAPAAPTMASSVNIGAFNLGNALGAYLGGLAIAAGFGFTAPIWIGAGLSFLGLVVIVVASALSRRKAAAGGEGFREVRRREMTASSRGRERD